MTIGMLLSGVLFMTCIVERAFVSEAAGADAIAQGIFVGQAYVSRHVYLKGFSDEQRRDWPDGLVASRLRPPEKTGAAQRLELTFSRVVNASGSDEYSDFPIRERAPGEDELNHPPDFFGTVLDSSLEDRDIGVYRTKQSISVGVSVLAWGAGVSLDVVDFRNNGKRRPMTNAETMEVADKKKAVETGTKDYKCTTEPGFLDSATEILRAKVKGSAFSIRISEYSNPGCAGHLEEVYVLDVWEDGKEPSRFECHHYVGAI